MKINLTVKFNKFLALVFIKELRNQISDAFVGGFEQFVENAAPNVPIDTGMARGSFLNAIAFLNGRQRQSSVYVPTTPQRILKNGQPLKYTHESGKVFPKTPASAKMLSTKPAAIFTFYVNKPKINFQTSIVHFNVNDPKWKAFEIGRLAMFHYIASYKYDLRLQKFSVASTVTYGDDSTTVLNRK